MNKRQRQKKRQIQAENIVRSLKLKNFRTEATKSRKIRKRRGEASKKEVAISEEVEKRSVQLGSERPGKKEGESYRISEIFQRSLSRVMREKAELLGEGSN